MRRKVDVSDLEIGMYVAELDRPWIGSPFLFQGFRVESEVELQQLRAYCSHVFVDDEMVGDAFVAEKTIRLSMGVRPDASPEEKANVWQEIEHRKRRSDFHAVLEAATRVRQQTRNYIRHVFEDVRLGRSVDTDTAKQIVHMVVDEISTHPDTMLWITQLKNRHEYTSQHCMNVCILSVAFAAHLGYSKEQMEVIGLGALMHDIGKVKVPLDILDKPGKLDAAEFEVMKKHPVDGHEIMLNTGQLEMESLDIVRHHHERLSGRGYPDGLSGSQISTSVLLVAICDVYDAMTSDRVYQHGIPAHEGLTAMYQLAPNEFGKELMQEFIRCIGIYPIGSLVELNTGDIGIVLTNDPKNRLRPVVMLVRDAEGDLYYPRRYISLSTMEKKGKGTEWSVRRIVDPRNYGVDFQQIIAAERMEGGSEVINI